MSTEQLLARSKRIAVGFPRQFRSQVEAAAMNDHRSLANMVEKIISDYLQANSRKKPQIRGKGALK